MAVNPDFGQVEVDQAVLNLTVFETLYPEKRPFFLEGSPIFSFGNSVDNRPLLLFYSRRIGKRPIPPSGHPAPGSIFVENPQLTSILGAAKLTGKTTDGLAIGALSAVTNKEEGVEESADHQRSAPILFEPRASYNVLRISKDLPGHSSVGLLATGTFKEQNLPALSGGVDWNLRLGDEMYGIDGYLSGSAITPSAGIHRTGGSGRIMLGKLQGEHWLAFSFYDFASPNFEINDLGFFAEPREHGGYTQVSYKEDHAEGLFLRYAVSSQIDYRWDWDGVRTERSAELEMGGDLTNFWAVSVDYKRQFPAFDDSGRALIRGIYLRPSVNEFTATVQSDVRQPVIASFQSMYLNSSKNLSSFLSSLQLTLRPATWIELTPAFTYGVTRDDETWLIRVRSENGFSVFGDRDVDQYDFSLRGLVMFTRNMSLQFFTQLFLAKGRYDNFSILNANDKLQSYGYSADSTFTSPNFNQKVVNANVVFRWEYVPGSTLYLVWTHERFGDNGDYERGFGNNIDDAFRLPSDNVLLLKLTYWWSL